MAKRRSYETAHAEKPHSFDDLPQDILDKDLKGLVGLEITVDKIEAASKLSQNRNEASYTGIIEHLKKMDAYASQRIAEEMERLKINKHKKGDLSDS